MVRTNNARYEGGRTSAVYFNLIMYRTNPRRLSFIAATPFAVCSWRGSRAPLITRRRAARVSRRAAPAMLLDSLTETMGETVRKLRGVDKISNSNVGAAMKQVKRALLDADVNLRVVNALVAQFKKRAMGAEVLPGVKPGEMLIKIMYEELAAVMGSKNDALAARTDGRPTVVLLAGLQGAGKTTAAAKLALYCLKEKRSVLLVAADVYRPAAIDQLKVLGDSVNVPVFSLGTDVRPSDIVRRGIEHAKSNNIDTVIVDTAGRQIVDAKLMKELKDIKVVSNADETLLVVDAMTGQEAAVLARSFNEQVGITGSILTKLDGDTRGGAALSVQQVSGSPIKFIGVGETVQKLEPFMPERMASRILGMGDVVTLVEKAQEQMDDKEAQKLTKKMMEAKFDFNDFFKQMKMISSMGSLGGVMKMLPGMGSISSSKMEKAEAKLKLADGLIKSMTKQERAEPELLCSGASSRSRIRRIAKGSGRTAIDAGELVRDFMSMRKMMSRMSKQMVEKGGGTDGMGMDMGAGNRAQRRKSSKKKFQNQSTKRGFG